MANSKLDPIHPEEAFQLYITEREPEVTYSTLQAHKYQIGHFLRWCEQEQITDLNTLTGRQLHQYKLWRQEEGDLNRVSVKTQMDSLRVFIRFCESIDAVPQGLSKKILSPKLDSGDNQSDAILSKENAHQLLDYLHQFEYVSFAHVLVRILWTTGMRIGTACSLDVDDYDPDERYLEIRHRKTTPLKNKEEGERLVAIDPQTSEVLDDWIRHQCPNVYDDQGREPLFATTHGSRSQEYSTSNDLSMDSSV